MVEKQCHKAKARSQSRCGKKAAAWKAVPGLPLG
jgi:hypothetical protein